jgi:pyridoxal phosphate enzyme (YggS family)
MSTARGAELAEALAVLRARVETAAAAAGRSPREIELLPVTKFFPASDVIELHRLGCSEFGESREQEASNKIAEINAELPGTTIRWHMIGRVQRNKARALAGWAYAVHAVDKPALIDALDRAAAQALDDGRRTEPLRVYIQVSLDGNPERGGVDIADTAAVDALCAAADAAPGLRFEGLMAIPPLGADAGAGFARLAAERARVQTAYPQRLGLSAGMSSDLEQAIQHGSTCVRVGTALMGQRPLTSP